MKFKLNDLKWTREPVESECKWLAHDGQQPDYNVEE